MDKYNIDWTKKHILKIGNELFCVDNPSEENINWRKKIEPLRLL